MKHTDWQLDRNDGVAFAANQDVGFMVWSAPATVERGHWLGLCVEGWLAQRAGDVVVVQVILATSKPPDAATRADARQFLDRIAPRLRKLITLPIGNELWSVLVRMVLRGLNLFGRELDSVAVASVEAAIAAVDDVRPLSAGERRELTEMLHKLVRVDALLAERRAVV